MTDWRDHKRVDTSYSTGSGGPVSIPLGPGEWDEGLGIPMCVVCQGVCLTYVDRTVSVVANSRATDNRPRRLRN